MQRGLSGYERSLFIWLATTGLAACDTVSDPIGLAGAPGISGSASGGQIATGGTAGAPPATGGSSGSQGSEAGAAGTGGAASGGSGGGAGASGGGSPPGDVAGGAAASGAGAGGTGGGGAGGTGGGGTGGGAGSGGAAGGGSECLPVPAATGGTEVCTNKRARMDSGYSYELWADSQSGCMRVPGVDANYSATWTQASDFLVRSGLVFDSTKTPAQIGTIKAQFAETFTEQPVQGATSKLYVALYGWTLDPLMEYYVIEDYGDFIPGPTASDGSPRTNYGTLTVDGGTYDIWALPVKNRPAITGNNMNFTQIFNVRRVRRKCGQISLSEHFAKWSEVGLTLGKLEEAMFLMEAQNNSGTVNVTATVTLN